MQVHDNKKDIYISLSTESCCVSASPRNIVTKNNKR